MNRPDADKPQISSDSHSDVSADQTQFMNGDTDLTGSSKMASQPEAWIGRRLGKYLITERVGIGGMGIVFKAHDNLIERDVAIKLLPPEIASDDIALGRFLSEARSAGKLNHPHAVTIHEVASDGNVNYLVMELVQAAARQITWKQQAPIPSRKQLASSVKRLQDSPRRTNSD